MTTVDVYVRHSADCKYAGDRDCHKCDCPRWLTYQFRRKQFRVSAHTRSTERATKDARQLEQDLQAQERGEPVQKKQSTKTIEEAVTQYLAEKTTQGIGKSALQKQTLMMTRLKEWATARGYLFLRDITSDDLSAWRTSWRFKKHADGSLSASWKVHWSIIAGLFKHAHIMGWTDKNEAAKLRSFKASHQQVQPFSKTQMKSILDAIDKCGWEADKEKRVRALVLLMRWSGLAIGDACCLKRSALDNQNRIKTRRKKTGTEVFILLPATVATQLRALPKENPEYFFWNGTTGRECVAVLYREYLNKVFETAEVAGHPHMFRHTFSVENLIAGIPLETVSRLLGHKSVNVTERTYAAWVPERQAKLEQALRASLAVQQMD